MFGLIYTICVLLALQLQFEAFKILEICYYCYDSQGYGTSSLYPILPVTQPVHFATCDLHDRCFPMTKMV